MKTKWSINTYIDSFNLRFTKANETADYFSIQLSVTNHSRNMPHLLSLTRFILLVSSWTYCLPFCMYVCLNSGAESNSSHIWAASVKLCAAATCGEFAYNSSCYFAYNFTCEFALNTPARVCWLQNDEFNPLKVNQPLNSTVTQLTVSVISAQELPKPANSVLGERGEVCTRLFPRW